MDAKDLLICPWVRNFETRCSLCFIDKTVYGKE